MEPGKLARDRNPKVQKPRADRAGEYRSSESDCARAMAQAKSVLREISLMPLYARRTGRELPNPIGEQAESAIPDFAARSESESTEAARADRAGEYGRSSESDCARAMAQAKSVLREISLMPLYARRTGRELPNPVSEQAESAIPDFATVDETKPYTHSHPPAVQFGVFDLRLAKAIPDHFTLDPDLDFVVHNDGGAIELTETGFRRMVQAHSAGFDIVIGVDRRDVLRFPARSFADGSMR